MKFQRVQIRERCLVLSTLLIVALGGCAVSNRAPQTFKELEAIAKAEDIGAVFKIARDDQPLRALVLLEKILKKQPYLSATGAQVSAFLGRDNDTRSMFDSPLQPRAANKKLVLSELIAHDAIAQIVEASKNVRVIIIGEGHASQGERVFSHLLAKALKPVGFTHIGYEALQEGDENSIPQNGPTRDVGFYTLDPIMADYMRNAKKLGYEIFGYEPDSDETANLDQKQRDNARELGQARNIKRMLDSNPSAKILIHCGGAHGYKTLYGGDRLLMGAHLMALMGADVLSIRQNIPASKPNFDLEDYQVLLRAMLADKPTVFRQKDGKWHTEQGFDMVVFHPRVPDIHGRGGWMTMNGYRKLHLVDIPALPARTLVRAASWPPQARGIAMDQVLAYAGDTQAPLFLPVGEYLLVRVAEAGESTPLGRVTIK